MSEIVRLTNSIEKKKYNQSFERVRHEVADLIVDFVPHYEE